MLENGEKMQQTSTSWMKRPAHSSFGPSLLMTADFIRGSSSKGASWSRKNLTWLLWVSSEIVTQHKHTGDILTLVSITLFTIISSYYRNVTSWSHINNPFSILVSFSSVPGPKPTTPPKNGIPWILWIVGVAVLIVLVVLVGCAVWKYREQIKGQFERKSKSVG